MASISKKIDENITQIETMFGNWSDIVERRFDLDRCAWGDDPAIYVVYIDGLCDHELIENTLIKPITWEWRNKDTADLWEHIISCEGQTADYTQESDMDNVVRAVLRGGYGHICIRERSGNSSVIETFPCERYRGKLHRGRNERAEGQLQ